MRLTNTLTRRSEELPPARQPAGAPTPDGVATPGAAPTPGAAATPDGAPTRIGMYFCGPTVYQRIHVGNARPFVIAMWLRSWLRARGYDVRLVINITDVNDKIYEAAPGASAALAQQASDWYIEDTGLLGLGRPDEEPKATETVPEIVALIEELVAREMAYEAGGDVYFRVGRCPDYGCLSGQRPDEMQEQEPNPLKEDARDFALWKAHKPGEDTSWPSPWGDGRPGWHIECSAMAEKFLGPEFEIHGGGLDLVFPHHENELAQSRAAGRGFARVWMHNGMLRFTGEKMSKSLGNVAALRDVIEQWGRETFLLFLLTGHWSKPIDFSDETMTQAAVQAESFRNVFRFGAERPRIGVTRTWEHFVDALDDDFNTPAALAIMHSWRVNGFLDDLRRAFQIFGLESLSAVEFDESAVRSILDARRDARGAKDFATADRLRADLWRAKVAVADTPDGQVTTRYFGVRYMGTADDDPDVRRMAEEFETARWTGDRPQAKAIALGLRKLGYSIEELTDGAVVVRLGRA